MMKAAVFRGIGTPLIVESVEEPKPRPGDVIIKVHRCGICGTDLHMTSDHKFQLPVGSIPGHEYAGEIVELGSAVDGFKRGDRVTAVPTDACGQCAACLQGNLALCDNAHGMAGGFGEYLRVPAKVTVKLPSTLSLADGALIEPLAVGHHAVRMASIKPGDRVLIQGAGSVALCTLFWARRLGAGRIVVTSRSERRKPMALALGADAFVQSGENEVQEVAEKLGGAPGIVFECIGVPGFLSRSIQHVAKHGQVLSLGFCMAPETVIPAMAALKAVRLSFPVGWGLRDFQYAADMMDAGKADPRIMVTSVIPLNELPAMFEALRGSNAETKVQVSPGV